MVVAGLPYTGRELLLEQVGIPEVWSAALAGLAQAEAPSGGGWESFIFLFLILGIFYFVLIMPAQRQRKKQQGMLEALKNGDKVVTSGGVMGTVVGVKEKTVTLRVADNVRIEVMRSYIAGHQAGPDEASKG